MENRILCIGELLIDFICSDINVGLDELHKYEELDEQEVDKCNIVHFGSATAMLGGPSKDTYVRVMKLSKEKGKFISFDPNYRVDLWRGRVEEFIEISRKCIEFADLVKVSDEELKLISGHEDLDNGLKVLHKLGAKIITVTLGKDGTLISNGRSSKIVESIKIKSIDSTGAGDAFVGAFLFKLGEFDAPKLIVEDFDELERITSFANKVGAIVCTRLGAISSIPTLAELNNY